MGHVEMKILAHDGMMIVFQRRSSSKPAYIWMHLVIYLYAGHK